MKRLFAIFMAAMMMAAIVTGCAVPGQQATNSPEATEVPAVSGQPEATAAVEEPAQPKVLRLTQAEGLSSLDPSITSTVGNTIVLCGIFEGLVTAKHGEVIPGMAETWEVTEGNTVYTFHLRDAVWSDGKAVTAQDFYDTFARIATDPRCAEHLWYADPILNIAAISEGTKDISELGVKVLDDKTIQFTLSGPTPYFLQMLTHSLFLPTRSDLVAEQGEGYGIDFTKLAYNGPFTVTDWVVENKMQLTKNPTYWRADEINFDTVEFTVVSDTNTAKNMFDNGDIDFLTLSSSVAPLYVDYPGYSEYDRGGSEWLQFSTIGQTPETGVIMANRNIIWALSYAIDRTALDTALFSSNYPYTGVINPSITAYDDVKWGDFFPEATSYHPAVADVAKAKEYLATALTELGYASAEDMPAITLTVIDGEFYKTVGEYFQDVYQRELGIKVNVVQLQVPQFYQLLTSGEYDITMPGWSPDWDDPDTYMSMWHSSHPNNVTGLDTSDIDALLDQIKTEPDAKARAELYKQAETLLLTKGPIIPLHMRLGAVVSSERITGVTPEMFSPFVDYRWGDIVQ